MLKKEKRSLLVGLIILATFSITACFQKENKTAVSQTSTSSSAPVAQTDFVDHYHYPEYEKLLEQADAAEEGQDHEVDPIASLTSGRSIASVKEPTPPTPKISTVDAKEWGSFEISVTTYDHPSYAPDEVQISVTCKDQVKMTKPRPAPTKELVLKNLKACEFKGGTYHEETQTMTIRYLMQSPDAKPNEPTCNEIWEQDFIVSELCEKWTQRP